MMLSVEHSHYLISRSFEFAKPTHTLLKLSSNVSVCKGKLYFVNNQIFPQKCYIFFS